MTTTRSQRKNSGGNFLQRLPSEVLHMILDKMSVPEISVLSMVSKEITSSVVKYIDTNAWKNKMINQSFHHSSPSRQRSIIEHYRDLGLLFKRCTLLQPTKERLKFTVHRFLQVPCFTLEWCLAPDCFGFSSYGAFLQTLVAGWDELECQRVFTFVCDITNLLHKMESVVTVTPGVRWYQEVQVRHFCRQVLLDPWPNQIECQFWLQQLLRPWALVRQAHLLFILYGPLQPEGTISWQGPVQRGLPHNALWELARAILTLFSTQEVKGWNTDSGLAILEELFVLPQPWHLESIARLLVLCGSKFCYTFLARKILSGQLLETLRLIVYIILVCEMDGYQMNWALKLVQQLCRLFSTPPEKFSFVQHLENAFSEVAREFFQFSVTGNNREEIFHTVCFLLDSSARFHTRVLYKLMKQDAN
ncbi:F-box only protein 47-like [Aulostomus maculatus]